jgi:hypothetical protein
MKKIWVLIKNHLHDDFSIPLYTSIALFIATGVAINYTINLEDGIIDKDAGKPIRILWYLLLYSFAYYGSALITFSFRSRLDLFKKKEFWFLTLAGLFILSWNIGFPYLTQATRLFHSDYRVFSWAYSTTSNLINFFTTALPLILIALFVKDSQNFGLTRRNVDLKPYWWILLTLVPIIAIASFEAGFKSYYPTYKSNDVAEVLNWPTFLPPLVYEVAYGLDFFNVEFMFRGFMVIGLARLLGKEAILPMVCTYCFLHFGKPIGEAISSVFGGYILGVVALYTRNIWGGVMVHIGLAWMMEIAAYLQKNL